MKRGFNFTHTIVVNGLGWPITKLGSFSPTIGLIMWELGQAWSEVVCGPRIRVSHVSTLNWTRVSNKHRSVGAAIATTVRHQNTHHINRRSYWRSCQREMCHCWGCLCLVWTSIWAIVITFADLALISSSSSSAFGVSQALQSSTSMATSVTSTRVRGMINLDGRHCQW